MRKNGADSYETYIDIISQIRLSLNSLSILLHYQCILVIGILIEWSFLDERSFLRYY